MNRTIAVCDVGGTRVRFALASLAGGKVVTLGEPASFATADFADFGSAWRRFGGSIASPLPDALGIALAGPVRGDTLRMTNAPWVIRPKSLKDELGVSTLHIINDFGAIGHAVAALGDEHFEPLFGPPAPAAASGTTTIIGPGTGLGVAVLLRADGHVHVIETEGGHGDFAPLDEIEDELLAKLRKRHGRVSVERLASGPGLAAIASALAEIEQRGDPLPGDAELWAAALGGHDPHLARALDCWCRVLGAVAGDLALAHGAGEVVIAGALALRLRDRLAGDAFRTRFTAKGRYQAYMESIPVKLITHPQPGLYGAAVAFARANP